MSELLHTERLSIGYPAQPDAIVLAHELNLKLAAGELICLLGPNGTGKSTLIRTLAALQPALAGDIFWNGKPLSHYPARERATHVAIVLTHLENTGNMSVEELIMLGRHPYTGWFGQASEEDTLQVQRALEQTGMLPLRDRIFQTLSDGERQRALIARALAQQSRIILLDEPTAFLDLPGRARMMQLLRDMARKQNIAILLSTHDLSLALDIADTFWLLEDNEHLHQGAPEDLILNGTLERTFAKDGIILDEKSGSLRLDTPTHHKIALSGQGERCHWTAHALKRYGYAIIENADAQHPHIEVTHDHWVLRAGSTQQKAFNIRELITILSTLRKT